MKYLKIYEDYCYDNTDYILNNFQYHIGDIVKVSDYFINNELKNIMISNSNITVNTFFKVNMIDDNPHTKLVYHIESIDNEDVSIWVQNKDIVKVTEVDMDQNKYNL